MSKLKNILPEKTTETPTYESIEVLLDDLLMTSTTLSNIGNLMDKQVDETELRPTADNFSMVNTLIKYNLKELDTLNLNLNDLWHKINDFIKDNM